jgi:hypothetical protein
LYEVLDYNRGIPSFRTDQEQYSLPRGAAVAQRTLNPLTLVRIQAGQPKMNDSEIENTDFAHGFGRAFRFA